MIKGNIGQEAEQLFKELGMEDTTSKLSDMLIDNFMIQGEETEDLKEALHRAPDGLVDLEEAVGFYEDFLPYRWVFSFCEDGKCTFIVMNECYYNH